MATEFGQLNLDFLDNLSRIGSTEAAELTEAYSKDPVLYAKDKYPDIEFTEDQEKVLAEVAKGTRKILLRSANGTGKTFILAFIADWFAFCFFQAKVFMTTAPPEKNLETMLWAELENLYYNYPENFENVTKKKLSMDRVVVPGEEKDEKTDIRWIRGWTVPTTGTEKSKEAKFSGKHTAHMLWIGDEGDAIPNECFRGMEACCTFPHNMIIASFNPRGEMGWTWHAEDTKEAKVIVLSAFNHPNVVTGDDKIPGAASRQITLQRIHEWTRELAGDEEPDDQCFSVDKECPYLVGATTSLPNDAKSFYDPLPGGWRKIVEQEFYYMVMGRYPAAPETQLIQLEWINRAIERWHVRVATLGEEPLHMVTGVAALDVATMGKAKNVMAFKYGNYIPHLTSWTGMDANKVAKRAAREFNSRDLSAAYVDDNGVGAGVPGLMLDHGATAIGVKSHQKAKKDTTLGGKKARFNTMGDELWWGLREWLRTEDAMLPPNKDLKTQLLAPKYEERQGKIYVTPKQRLTKILMSSPDEADAVRHLFYPDDRLFPDKGIVE